MMRALWVVALAAVAATAGAAAGPAAASFSGGDGLIAHYDCRSQACRTGGTGDIVVIDPVAGSVRTVLPSASSPFWSADGSRLAAIIAGDAWTADASGGTRARVTTTGDVREVAWAPDGTRLAVVRGDGVLWTVHPDGTGLQQVTGAGTRTHAPKWSPDGSRLAYTDVAARAIVTVAADGTGRRVLASELSYAASWCCHSTTTWRPWSADWSPDGSALVVGYVWTGYCEDGCSLLFRVPASGGTATPLGGTQGALAPVWAPKGGRVVWEKWDGLYASSVSTGAVVLLRGGNARVDNHPFGTPAWQPVPATTASAGTPVASAVPRAALAEGSTGSFLFRLLLTRMRQLFG